VTRLGKILPFGHFFLSLGEFFYIAQDSPRFGLLFVFKFPFWAIDYSGKMFNLIFGQNFALFFSQDVRSHCDVRPHCDESLLGDGLRKEGAGVLRKRPCELCLPTITKMPWE
jgi:hypothetical protein